MKPIRIKLFLRCLPVLLALPCAGQSVDVVKGDLITFQPDGAWSWFQDERVIVTNGQIVLGSVAAKVEGDLPGYTLTPRDPGDIIACSGPGDQRL